MEAAHTTRELILGIGSFKSEKHLDHLLIYNSNVSKLPFLSVQYPLAQHHWTFLFQHITESVLQKNLLYCRPTVKTKNSRALPMCSDHHSNYLNRRNQSTSNRPPHLTDIRLPPLRPFDRPIFNHQSLANLVTAHSIAIIIVSARANRCIINGRHRF